MSGESQIKKEPMTPSTTVAVLNDVSFSSPDRLLFYGVNLPIQKGETIALMGESGVGKTTLLQIVMGKKVPDSGSAALSKNVKVSYVPQDIEDLEVDENISIQDLFYKARGLDLVEREKNRLEHTLAEPENAGRWEELMEQYSQVTERYEELGGYGAESEVEQILAGLKLDPETTGHINITTRLNEVSSGQKNRILIGQALFAQSDLLVLDDPTSHLDAESVEWLANYIKQTSQAAMIATNNVPFINASANKLVEITHCGRVLAFKGTYPDYVEKRDRLLEAEKAEADAVKAERDRIEATFQKFKSQQVFKRSSAMAATGRAMQSRISRLEDQFQSMPGSQQVFRSERIPNLHFEQEERSGEEVVSIRGLMKRYEEFLALDLRHLELTVKRGELLLLSGANGSGKSTLLRMIAGAIDNDEHFAPDAGKIQIGPNVKAKYYAPDRTGIGRKGSIIEEVTRETSVHNEGQAASILHYWGFPKGTIYAKFIEQLSAGERKQLALAKIMYERPNLLLLDEPTDYLKPEVVQRLPKALEGYDGTTILISHNPEFKALLPVSRELHLPKGKVTIK